MFLGVKMMPHFNTAQLDLPGGPGLPLWQIKCESCRDFTVLTAFSFYGENIVLGRFKNRCPLSSQKGNYCFAKMDKSG